jgi:glycosyltransferase involved in cell wall biosynthesis
MSRSVGVVIPAFEPDLSLLVEYLQDLERVLDPAVLRVELDAPDPETVRALEATAATVNAVDRRRGKGAAVTDGFEALDTAILAFADADGSTPAQSIADVVAAVQAGRADLAVGSRRHPAAEVKSHQTVFRQHLGDVFAWLARRFLDVSLSDYQCGAKALTRETWTAIREHLYEAGFAWDVEVVAMADALEFAIEEVPVTWQDHPDSTVETTQAVPELLKALFAARRRSRRLRCGAETSMSPHCTERKPLVHRQR